MSNWYSSRHDGVLVVVRVTPNAGRDGIDGIASRADGSRVLKLRVSAPPDQGRANAATIALLAKALGLPRRLLTLRRGETARTKTVLVAAGLEEIASSLARLEA